MINKKDLIAINQEFHNGKIANESSLEFVLSQTYRSTYWFKTMCLLVRAILIDHIFEDGNKRTAGAVIMAYLDSNGILYNPDHIPKTVLIITKSNQTNINQIGRLLRNVFQ